VRSLKCTIRRIEVEMDSLYWIFYAALAAVIIGTALAVIFTRNAIMAVLMLVLNFTFVAFLYLLLGAPFIALAQVSIYAGAIMVLFLFVIMMLGADRLKLQEHLLGQRVLLVLAAVAFVVLFGVFLIPMLSSLPPMPPIGTDFGDPKALGILLFSKYQLPLMAISVLLLVAAVGAVVITKREKN
jgi:NADH-quinone oxidoreductase subunit J